MSDEQIIISGLQDTQKTLYSYSQQMGDRVVRMALRQGANHILRGIRELVPVRTGLLRRRGFRVANSRIHNGRRASELIGIYISLRKGQGDPFYGRFQNDGWVPQRAGQALKGGNARRDAQRESQLAGGKRRVSGKGFVQRAFAERREDAVQIAVQSAEAGAEAIKRRLGMN